MVSLFHENQVYRRLLPRVRSYLLLCLFIEQVINLVENLAEFEIVVKDNVVFLRSSLGHLEGKRKVLYSILLISIRVYDGLLHIELLVDIVQYFCHSEGCGHFVALW